MISWILMSHVGLPRESVGFAHAVPDRVPCNYLIMMIIYMIMSIHDPRHTCASARVHVCLCTRVQWNYVTVHPHGMNPWRGSPHCGASPYVGARVGLGAIIPLSNLWILAFLLHPPPTIVNNEASYDVEQVLDHRDVRVGNRMERQYLVKWLNWGIE